MTLLLHICKPIVMAGCRQNIHAGMPKIKLDTIDDDATFFDRGSVRPISLS